MPLYQRWKINDHAEAAIWRVTEDLLFFEEATGLRSEINNIKRRTEHLAGRYLLQSLVPGLDLGQVQIDEFGKPFLPRGEVHFSVSHSWPWVAVVADRVVPAGIDIQTWHPRIAEIQHKYLSDEEQNLLVGPDEERITLAWCAKESVYKWHGKKGIEFIEQLPIQKFSHEPLLCIEILITLNAMPQNIVLNSIINTDFACVYVAEVQ